MSDKIILLNAGETMKIIFKIISALCLIAIIILCKNQFKARYEAEKKSVEKYVSVTPPEKKAKLVLNLRTAGISSQIPLYSNYKISFFDNYEVKVNKTGEYTLATPAALIAPLLTSAKTIILQSFARSLLIFDEKQNRFLNENISFEGKIINNLAVSADEKFIAAICEASSEIIIISGGDLKKVTSFTINSKKLKKAYFNSENDLFIIAESPEGKTTELYRAPYRLSYARNEKVCEFPLVSTSIAVSAEDNINYFYNERTNTLFSMDTKNMQSGAILISAARTSKENVSDLAAANGKAYLLRSDIGKIEIYKNGKKEAELSCGISPNAKPALDVSANKKYMAICSDAGASIRILSFAEGVIYGPYELEGLSSVSAVDINE